MVEWVIPTLLTINSDRLEYVGLGECVVADTGATRDALATLDSALAEGPCKLFLQRIDTIMWARLLPDGVFDSSDDCVVDFVRSTLPICCARQLVYHTSSEDPL